MNDVKKKIAMSFFIASFICFLMVATVIFGEEKTNDIESSKNENNHLVIQDMHGNEGVQPKDQSEQIMSKMIKENRASVSGFRPTAITIPAIDVKADIIEVGKVENGQMEVPADDETVGWYNLGYKPGEYGNAVLAGHVDNKQGPAIFFYLKELNKGDHIILYNEKGEAFTFEVTQITSYQTDNAPIGEIFGYSDQKQLNLITCTGTFNRETGDHEKRLVVTGKLIAGEDNVELNAPTQLEIQGNFIKWHAVRDDSIVGYRIYRSSNGENFNHIASVSSSERKTLYQEELGGYQYYITSVNINGEESKPSEVLKSAN